MLDKSIFNGTRIVVLDIETTDKIVSKARVREFGAAEFVNGEMFRSSSATFSGGICDPGALRVHGISDESVNGKPSFEDKAHFAKVFLSNKILAGHNIIAFDLPIVQKCVYAGCKSKITGDGPGGKIRVIDTLLLARKHFRLPSNKLEDLCAIFGIEHGKHRGLGDSMSCWNILLKIIETSGCKSLDELIVLN